MSKTQRKSSSAGKYSKADLLNVLSEVKTRVQDKLGIVDFPMPQFILLGNQSVGKSRLVETIAGQRFNFVSGTLGSRRPTVLEFRHVSSASEIKWYVLDQKKSPPVWVSYDKQRVMELVGHAHQSLGNDVSSEAVKVRIESNACPDMQIVDLPGYRGFAHNKEGQILADKIMQMNETFLKDPRNTIMCVEEAGDAANMSTLNRVKNYDPQFKRTILIRNKLDKYYNDLTPGNVNQWLEGMGDIPPKVKKFALTLPHWPDDASPPSSLAALREEMKEKDMEVVKKLMPSKMFLDTVGWNNFSAYVEKRTEQMFIEAIAPVIDKLRVLEQSMEQQEIELEAELESLDPAHMLATVRTCGASFAHCLNYVMEGYIGSKANCMTLEQELRLFHEHHKKMGNDIMKVPSPDFADLEAYITYLKTQIKVPACRESINGGAQFRRLLFEVECFLRFSEIEREVQLSQVAQGLGISIGSVTWKEVIVKVLNHYAHLQLQDRVKYVGERIKWFFLQQKEAIVEFMLDLKGSTREKLYSVLHTKNARLLQQEGGNQTIRKLVYDTYDQVADRQLHMFLKLFESTLHATFSNPWVFSKSSTAGMSFDDEVMLPSLDDIKTRIQGELENKTGMERTVMRWIYNIPTEPHRLDESGEQVQLVVLKVYSHIRSQMCDQVELFAESFFKLPLMRLLEEDMMKIELSQVDREGYRVRREKLTQERTTNSFALKEVQECAKSLRNFVLTNSAISTTAFRE
jgi:GTP-binding protein EngB required for normal cell division